MLIQIPSLERLSSNFVELAVMREALERNGVSGPWTSLFVVGLLCAASRFLRPLPSKRQLEIAATSERVLIIGASSGVGEVLAKDYAQRGARIAIVGRRSKELERVLAECNALSSQATVISFAADFANAEDMVRVRTALESQWGGLDTLHVVAGVSALRPLLEISGSQPGQALTAEEITRTVNIADKAIDGNYHGPMVAALAFIPLLTQTSKFPSIVLLNSLASLIPAPTRTIYASTKSSSLLLYQGLAIEHPKIKFSFIIPSTIEGSFRASAVDEGPVRESDPNKGGLKKASVARACMKAADRGTKFVWMPMTMRFGHMLYWWWPSLIERLARRKYKFEA